jgi:hypothetical protein
LNPRAGSACRVEIVDPIRFAESASRVLRDAWQPPCLCYRAAYLRWQFGFPGASAAIGGAAFDGDELIGFFAAVPRAMRCGHRRVASHLLSFFAVLPRWRGPLSLAIYGKLIEAIKGTEKPVVTYVPPGSIAEKMLVWNFERAGFQTYPLGSYRTYGAPRKPGSAIPDAQAVEADEDEFLEMVGRCRDERTLWSDPDRAQLHHYRQDPRGCALAVIREASGSPVGAAIVVLSEAVLPKGIELIPMIDSVFLPRPSAEALIALVRFAGERWTGQATSPVVTAPNLKGIDSAVLRAAGLRATASSFQGYFFAPTADVVPRTVEGTNLEVV